VICLGNSLTHLFSEQDRRKALAEFYSVLNHDGVLILDQRNYDGILDNGFTSKHVYYYCGDNVSAEAEYVDEGLARFRYRFPDNSEYHLNMYPLRKDYVRKLMNQVGFQQVKTYADFQETHRVEDPDFYVHIAEKMYKDDERTSKVALSATYSQTVETARNYYNSSDASTRLTAMSALKKMVLETLEKLGWQPLKDEGDDQITDLQYTDPDKVLGEEGRFGPSGDFARPAKGLKIER